MRAEKINVTRGTAVALRAPSLPWVGTSSKADPHPAAPAIALDRGPGGQPGHARRGNPGRPRRHRDQPQRQRQALADDQRLAGRTLILTSP